MIFVGKSGYIEDKKADSSYDLGYSGARAGTGACRWFSSSHIRNGDGMDSTREMECTARTHFVFQQYAYCIAS